MLTEKELGEVIAFVTKDCVDRLLKPITARIEALEARPSMKYLGVWRAREYSPGSFVTDHGAVWHCEKTTTARPGASADWILAVKSGAKGD